MREILFRGKRKDNGEWVEGSLLQTTAVSLKSFIIESSCYTFDKWDWNKCVQVDTDTICQYTGLTDKNGDKIWENDVVRRYADTDDLGNDLYFFYKVIWHERYHCWWLSDIHTLEDEYLHQYNSSDIEVIGNVFDNTDLLKGV